MLSVCFNGSKGSRYGKGCDRLCVYTGVLLQKRSICRACFIELLQMDKEAETVIEINRAMAVYPNCCESNFLTVINSVIAGDVKEVK